MEKLKDSNFKSLRQMEKKLIESENEHTKAKNEIKELQVSICYLLSERSEIGKVRGLIFS
jgi:hypothetical protein